MTIRTRAYYELDYTKSAYPGEWSMEMIRCEVEECCAHTAQEPTKIILWEYQWDWLKKKELYAMVESAKMGILNQGQSEERPPELWGIPVEVKK